MLEDTLVIWGRIRQNQLLSRKDSAQFGRDHHPRCFTMWLAGGGTRSGLFMAKTDELGYNITENPVHIHDLQATLMHLLGIDHEQLTYKFQGRRYRLTDVHGHVVQELLG